MQRPEPTGRAREFGAGELFFSTTDARGHIVSANDVFVRLSGYRSAELLGAPHSIVRHPEMPAGVFRTMWNALEGGNPFAGYIRNLAADGSHYDVFATVTALPGGGYLSVRSKPMSEATHADIFEAYSAIVAKERKARSDAGSARDAATIGAALLDNAVRDLGYDGYVAFQRAALLREVMLREEALQGSLGMVVTNTIDPVVRAALGIHAEVSVLSFEQETLETLAKYIDSVLRRIRKDIELQAAAELGLWDAKDSALRSRIDALQGELASLGTLSRDTQFHVSLARLHSAMVTQFADERFSMSDPEAREAANVAISRLIAALVAAIDVMLQHIESLHVAIARARSSIAAVTTRMRERRELVDAFLDDAFERGTDLTAKAEAMEPAFTQSIIDADVALDRLDSLSITLDEFDADYDAAPLEAMRQQLIDARHHT